MQIYILKIVIINYMSNLIISVDNSEGLGANGRITLEWTKKQGGEL
jgi:hypothetical protein